MKNAELYFESMLWGGFGPGETHKVNSYEGHHWNVRVNGKVVKEIVVGKDLNQIFEI
jgi:hypothetical protein